MIFGSNKAKAKTPKSSVSEGPESGRYPIKKNSRTRRVLRHMFLPEILPRISNLGAHFNHFSFLLALIFRAVRLLPYNHPFLNSANTGRFGIRDVIGAAANNVVLKRENFDQIAIFGAVIMSLVLLVVQAVVICGYTVISQAKAASFFATPTPEKDVVFVFLEQVFGANLGIFQAGTDVLGTPVHNGLYAMLSFYSMAMMVLAVFIVVYYIITVVGEAAISGTPFGRRFNSLWAPIRLVFALGLLVPISGGLNSAQFITLYIAKMGSGMATQGWIAFSTQVAAPMNVFVKADPPVVLSLVKGIYLTEICAQTKDKIAGSKIINVKENIGGNVTAAFSTPAEIFTALAARPTIMTPYIGPSMGMAAPMYSSSSVHYIWDESAVSPHQHGVCGRVSVPLTESGYTLSSSTTIEIADIRAVQEAYIGEVAEIQKEVALIAKDVVDFYVNINNVPPAARTPLDDAALAGRLQAVVNAAQGRISDAVTLASRNLETRTGAEIKAKMTELGWGGAGLWYSRLGQINQQFSTAVASFPAATAYITSEDGKPWAISEWIESLGNWLFGRNGDADKPIENMRNVMKNAYEHFDSFVTIEPSLITKRYSMFSGEDGISRTLDSMLQSIFGVSALYDFRADTARNLDPMVGLMAVGQELITKSGIAIGVVLGGSVVGSFIPGVGKLVALLAPFLFIFVMIGFGVGLLLAYLLPLMPFIYFFFAIASWVMEIFEAVVAMPLWALAHLKIDGDGLPGPLAANGYFLLLGIFIRPILIVFGFVGGLLVFGAATYFLFSTFDLLVGSVNGDREVNGVSTFIYTLIFGFLVYNLGLTCFKMVDTIPQGILRWIGQGGASQFSDNKQDPMGGGQAMMFAGVGVMQQASSAMQGIAGGAARLGKGGGSGGSGGGGSKGATLGGP